MKLSRVLETGQLREIVPSRSMLLGDEATAKHYGIDSLPDAFLVDRHGNIAAAYTNGMVDRDNLAANIQALLGGR